MVIMPHYVYVSDIVLDAFLNIIQSNLFYGLGTNV